MDLFDCDLRWCGYCKQPLPADLEHYARHKYGRGGWATVCRWCANLDRAHRYRMAKEHPREEGQLCACGEQATQLGHCHETGAFIAWKCRACNLRGRRADRVGTVRSKRLSRNMSRAGNEPG